MRNDYFIKELNYELKQPKEEIKDLISKMGVDAVHLSGEYPAVFFKDVNDFGFDTLKEIAGIQKNIWNDSSVAFLYVVSPAEIRIYNCNEVPFNYKVMNEDSIAKKMAVREIISCKESDIDKLEKLKNVFSSVAIDSGLIWNNTEYARKIKHKTKVDNYLVKSLLALADKLKEELDDKLDGESKNDIIHSLLIRSIFIMYLQDRKAVPQEIWNNISCNDFLEVLENKDNTYRLFKEIDVHFNGNIFPVSNEEKNCVTNEHLKLIKQCLINGNFEQKELFADWRLFDFKIIRIELLSELYENFLKKFQKEKKKRNGVYYTSPALVELVLNNILPKDDDKNYKLKIMDPACGSGIFLVQAFKRLVKRWQNAHSNREPNFKELSELMKNSIFGIEIDKKSIKVAVFSLYLALLDFLEPKDVWLKNGEKFPYLINFKGSSNNNLQNGHNLFLTDAIEQNEEIDNNHYDIIIGNPPFGSDKLPKNIFKYCKDLDFSKQYVIPFIHKSAEVLAPEGKIALLFNTKILTNNKGPAQNFRKWLFNECYVEKVFNLSILRKIPEDYGGNLFSTAVAPVSIVIFQKQFPDNPKPTIEYWAPKTYIKSHVVNGIIIDGSDIKYLPRELCQKPDTKIWKIAQWGSFEDYRLCEIINHKFKTLSQYFDENKNIWRYAAGLNADSKKLDFIPQTIIKTQKITRYYTGKKATYNNVKKYRSLDSELFNPPFVLIKLTQEDTNICASFIDYFAYCLSTAFVINGAVPDDIKKCIVAYMNSSFTEYFLFFASSSWGIEREKVMEKEFLTLPAIIDNLDSKIIKKIAALVDEIIKIKKDDFSINEIEHYVEELNRIIIDEIFGFNEKQKIIINDIINNNIDLFKNQQLSQALKPISPKNPETVNYAIMLCNELNEFLASSSYKVNASVYIVNQNTPLCMVKIKFEESPEIKETEIIQSDKEYREYLKTINKHSIQKYSQNIYIRKQIRYYDGDALYIIKPNQKRFWTRSQGIEDAQSIINEIAMEE